jgi:predicted lipoprotein with Yx(FWY)xxD motif
VISPTRRAWTLAIACAVVMAGCGSDSETPAPPRAADPQPARPATSVAADEAHPRTTTTRRRATRIVVGESQFGTMLFDARKQAIYIFERDGEGRSVCYGECAKAWPPVYTDGPPVAASGVRDSLLGTVKRRDGRLQVTYAGRPLYFYAHERPGEVRCHNVDLNGGLWWVVGPNGKRRP